MDLDTENKIAVLLCIEMVLVRRGIADYERLVDKLRSHYNCAVIDCFDHPEYLRTIITEIYKKESSPIINEIRTHLGDLASKEEISEFLLKFGEH